MKRHYWWGLGALILCAIIAIGVRGFRNFGSGPVFLSEEQQETLEAGLALEDVSLEQQDDNGQLLWKVNADKVIYSPDQETANLVQVEAELYQRGELLYRVQADKGTILEDGQVILLQENILAIGIQNQMEIRGKALEWRSEEDVMILRDGLTGTHPQVRIQAQEAWAYDQENRMELQGQVVATTVVENPKEDPWLKLQGESLAWQWKAEEISHDQPIRVERFEDRTITEVLTGKQGLFEISENRMTATDNVRTQIIEIPLEIASDEAIWDVDAKEVDVTRPTEIVNDKEKINVMAQTGQLDLEEQVVYLNQDVVVEDEKNTSRLKANRVTWNLVDQTILAEGAVDYQQGNPPVTVRGARATGRIENQTVVVDGGRVVTEIVPPPNQ